MYKLCLVILLIFTFLSCNEENDVIEDRYLNNIIAGQDSGNGIHYVEYDPPVNLANSGSGPTIINLDMDNDEADDFELVFLD